MNGTNQDEELKENESSLSTDPAEIEAEVKHSLSTDPATIEAEMNQELANVGTTYSGLKENAATFYDGQKTEVEQWGAKQQALQQQRTDFTIEQINQQKEQSAKDYAKEQSGAYTDWQKESNKYGANAEQMAAGGLAGSGYSESAQVQMYNTYQNRVAAAREAYNMATLNYNNAIKDAQLQNSSALAQIAYDTYQQQLALTMQAFQFENELVLAEASKRLEIQSMYHGQYMDALAQQNWQAEYDRLVAADEEEARRWQAEYDRAIAADEEEARRWQEEYDLKVAAQEAEKQQFEFLYGGAEIGESNSSGAMGILEVNEILNEAMNPSPRRPYTSGGAMSFPNIPGTGPNSFTTDGATSFQNNKNTSLVEDTSDYPRITLVDGMPRYDGLTLTEWMKKYKGAHTLPGTSISTKYYVGELNADTKEGVFSNGYQPDNIFGQKLTKTGKTEEVTTTILYGADAGKEVKVKQNIWKAQDGSLWLWNGTQNRYVPYE